MARIPDEILECVFYLYPTEADAKAGERAGGTGFMLGLLSEADPGQAYHFAVTNSHVIREGQSSILRINTADGGFEVIPTNAQNWVHHELGDDVAVCPLMLSDKFKYRSVGAHQFVEKNTIVNFKIGPGDDVFMVGRFINHEGKERNRPTVRSGIIAMMPDEPIRHPTRGIDQESFLIETHSVPGYSGSPVFIMILQGTPRYGFEGIAAETYGPFLVGLDWCHIPDLSPVLDKNDLLLAQRDTPIDENWIVRSNTGMMGVVPAWKIREVLEQDELRKPRLVTEQQLRTGQTRAGQT